MTRKKGRRRAAVLRRVGLGNLGYVGKWVGLATLIGLTGGLAAVAFDWLLEVFRERAFHAAIGTDAEGLAEANGSIPARAWWLLLLLPAGGLVVGWLTRTFAPEAEGHGTEQLIKTFHQLGGKVRKRVVALKALTSALTIGTGGSAGQEGPVAQIGSGVGSVISGALKLPERDRRVFLLAGSSAGIGALFTAPLGGALFAPEVLYRKPEFEGDAIIPCIISSIIAYATFTTITGETKAIHIAQETLDKASLGDPRELALYLALALLCTVVSYAYVRIFDAVRAFSARAKLVPPIVRPALGGLALAVLALAIAPFAGTNGVLFGGYELMKSSIAGDLTLKAMALLAVAKILSTSFSIASGGSGGVFAPSLAIGALLGGIVGQAAEHFFPEWGVSASNFALVGMGGFFAGVAKTPIASIVIVCEMTGSYGLLAPLMLVSVLHLLLANRWTIYDTQVNGLVDSPAHTGDFVVDVLERMKVADLLVGAREPTLISANTTLRRALDVVSKASGNYFPVVDKEQKLVGIFSLSDVRRIFQETEVADLVIVHDFMVDRVVTVTSRDSLNDALQKLNEFGLHEIPVVDDEDPQTVVSMLTRNNLGAAYHQKLRDLRRSGAG